MSTPVYHPPAPDHEPLKILIKRDELIDPARQDRHVPIKVYYPAGHTSDRLPVIIWSHGLGGSREGAGFLARYIASNGYIIVNTQHPGTDASLWEGKPGHPWDVIRSTPISPEATLNRFADIPFVLDCLPEWIAGHEEIADIADLSRLGMSGHSFGALTTQVMAGQPYPDADGKLISLKEERITAGILYSPVPVFGRDDLDPADLYGPITLPLLHMTGTDDKSPIEGFDYTERLAIFNHAKEHPQYLVTLDEGDHMIFAGSRGKLADNPKRDTQEALIKVLSLVFWDAFLKGDQTARHWLDESLEYFLAGDATIQYR